MNATRQQPSPLAGARLMRQWALASVVSAGVLAASGAAVAADLPTVMPGTAAIVTAPFSWTGFYGGMKVGAASTSGGWTSLTYGTSLGTTYSGPLLGARIGYNYQMPGNLVVGAEIEGNIGALYGSRTCVNAVFNCSQEARLLSSATVRVGYAFDRWMVYASGGLAYGAFDLTGTPMPGVNSPVVPVSHRAFGWAAGVGIEYALNEHVILDVGYKYYDFGTVTTVSSFAEKFRTQPRAHAVQLGISYKF